ncbi:rho guanine nucleotide exchange factor 10 isoform X2 [Clupea harengus]|uniref:Rho guanine nucleotide exchange factor 10 n=1 Tax=Clupea harengus TaxID=7950 RepID=A0A6P8GP67_CLUHA|nr:rho guanine nucleotide exchange factor 10 isoform X2 [Clupea harengus]
MDVEDFPPPPPEMLAEGMAFNDEDEGERFEFDDSGDDIPEADRPPPAPPAPDYAEQGMLGGECPPPPGAVAPLPASPHPNPTPEASPAPTTTTTTTTDAAFPPPPPDESCEAPSTVTTNPTSTPTSAAPEAQLPPPHQEEPPPPSVPAPETDLPPPPEDAAAAAAAAPDPGQKDEGMSSQAPGPPPAAPRSTSQGKVNPYSVIDITPFQPQLQPQLSAPASSPSSATEKEPEAQEMPSSPSVPPGYSVPVPCGYAVPSNVPMITPAYTTPVIIRHLSVDEDVTVVGTGNTAGDGVFTEEYPVIREEDALTKWVSDPANTAWMENPDEVIYDDVPRENSDSTDPDEMIYDDVELGDGGSSLGDGWSSSEFESYEEQSDGEGHGENGLPDAFVRRKTPSQRTHVQKLVKAAKDGTKDGLEKTKAAVKKGKSFMRTKSFCSERKSTCFDEEEADMFIDVDCLSVEPVLGPAPEGLSQQQVVRRCILGSILESEKNYIAALKRILEQYEKPLSDIEPKLLSDRKRKMMFHRVREILQCHALFQIALASRMAEWDSLEMIGDVFVASFSKSMVLDAYREYVNNFSTAMAVVRKACATKPNFLEFLKHRQEISADRVTLYGLMMKPIQRFPQFILLLQDMLKNTPVGHPDRLPLQMALTELETLAEKLNEKKREADQRCEIKHIGKAMNERYLNKLLMSGCRYLIRSDDMVETVYNDRGEIIKTKERRLFLLNDVLMCATPNARSPQEGGGAPTSGQKFLLKWSVPLSFVEVLEYGSSEEMGDSGRFPAPHSGEKVVINAKPNKLYMGPGQLYQDLQNLIHDLSLVNQISHMIGSLKGNYQNVNPTVAHDWVSGLQRLIRKKEEEIRAADRCRIQLQLPGKQDKAGKPTHFTAVFNTFGPAVKQSWISNLQMAKLALEEDNLQGWFFAEDDGNQIKKQKHPLLLKQMPVVMSKLQEFKVECAVHNPEPHVNSESTADMPALGHGFVWVASCTNQMGQISIVAMQNSSPKVTECFNVESRILCMAYVPTEEGLANGVGGSDGDPQPGKNTHTPTICLGMEEGSISVYKSSQRSKKVRLQHFFTPDKSTVTCLVYRSQYLYAGLVSGSVAIYSRAPDGSWNSTSPKVLKLGVLPVKALIAVEDHVWASSGGQVFIVGTQTHAVERQLEAHQEEGMVVSHMVVAGVGIWIAFSSGSTLRLFHTETLEHLQDINIATPVNSILSGHQRVSVSSLLVCHSLLLVGTNLGVIVALSVPRLQGIPKVTGRGMVSFHAHNSPVKFLTMAAAVCNLPQGSLAGSPPSQPAAPEGERPPCSSGPAPNCVQDQQVVCTGDAGSPSAPIAEDALSCGSLALSQGSLEHGPEDSAIYEQLNDPAYTQKSKRSQKVDVSSLLVVSGGLGHRRVNRKTKQSRHEETMSTIMVWQIPLANV